MMENKIGLVCPLCGSWYTDWKGSAVYWEVGDVCGNMSEHGNGPNFKPEFCTSDHPCPGKLTADPKVFAVLERWRRKRDREREDALAWFPCPKKRRKKS